MNCVGWANPLPEDSTITAICNKRSSRTDRNPSISEVSTLAKSSNSMALEAKIDKANARCLAFEFWVPRKQRVNPVERRSKLLGACAVAQYARWFESGFCPVWQNSQCSPGPIHRLVSTVRSAPAFAERTDLKVMSSTTPRRFEIRHKSPTASALSVRRKIPPRRFSTLFCAPKATAMPPMPTPSESSRHVYTGDRENPEDRHRR